MITQLQVALGLYERLTSLGSRASSARFPFLVLGFCILVSAPVVFMRPSPQAFLRQSADVRLNVVHNVVDNVRGSAERSGVIQARAKFAGVQV